MTVGTRSFKRTVERERVRAAKNVFKEALKVGEDVMADLKRVTNTAPIWRRAWIAMTIFLGVWK